MTFFQATRVSRGLARCALLCALLPLSACETLLPTAPSSPANTNAVATRAVRNAFALEARFSLRSEGKSYSGKLSWQHAGVDNVLLLSSPLGQGLAEIRTDLVGARLTMSDGKAYAAKDVEGLTRQVLGYTLPVTQLTEWVQGASGDDVLRRDDSGRPLERREAAWHVSYAYDGDDPAALPIRIDVEQTGGIDLRLRVDEWNNGIALGAN